MSNLKIDIEYGLKNEMAILELLTTHFGPTIRKTTDKYSTFDFQGENIMIELKSRRNSSELYPTTMIGHRKIVAASDSINKNIKYYYVFKFTDKIMYCEYNELDFKNFVVKRSGRKDRGRIETDDYCYIPIDYLIDLI